MGELRPKFPSKNPATGEITMAEQAWLIASSTARALQAF
jgi:hypothetical protein